MGGGLLQLVAVGAQDVFLTGNAGSTFWRQKYVRHSNFAVESIAQDFSGKVAFGNRASCTLSRNGDLVTHLVMEITLKKAGKTFYPAEHLLKEIELQIGGQRIDLLTNSWLRLYDELYRKVDAREAYAQMTDFDSQEAVGTVKRFFVPIPLWFSRGDPSTALPLISLQYHEVQLNFEFESAENIPGIDASFQPEITLWADYVYLDTEERRWFAQTAHEYLIEQTQVFREPVAVTSVQAQHNITLPFNHPVKYLAWVLKRSTADHGIFSGSLGGLESTEVCGPIATAGLQLNGIDRFAPRTGAYFRLQHPMLTFGQAPSVGVYVYSFAIHPAEPWPSGSLNCSRVDSIRLLLVTKAAVLSSTDAASNEKQTLQGGTQLKLAEIYARNHNVLRIMSGMGGLAYSN